MKKSVKLLTIIIVILLNYACKNEGKDTKDVQSDSSAVSANDPWDQVEGILKNIVPPAFPDKDFSVTDFGAVGDGKTNCTEAFKKAINECNSKGGGRVVVPEGKFFSGPIHLKSNVNLHISKGATILFSTVPDDYMPLTFTRWEGVELMNYSSLIYALDQENIAITGEGTLDGQATSKNWWPWKGKKEYGWKPGLPNQNDKSRPALFEMGEKNIPVSERKFGKGHFLRPQFVQPYRCKNVLIEGITIINSPMWILNPVLCENVTIKGVRVETHGPNNDGCDPESCKNLLIKDCFFNTGDDCIALKSGRNAEGRRMGIPCENVIIQNCTMLDGHGGVVIGSEISGGAKNIFAENCSMDSPELERVLRIKTSSMRGGVIEKIYVRNMKVGQVKAQVVLATMFYEDSGAYVPTIRDIEVKDIHVKDGGKTGILMEAYKSSPIKNFKLTNITIDKVENPYALYNVEGVYFNNVIINGEKSVLKDSVFYATDEEIRQRDKNAAGFDPVVKK
jgi:polygalacturonase